MSENVTGYVKSLINDPDNVKYTTTDIERSIQRHGIDLHYTELNAQETRVYNADSIYLTFSTDRNRRWLDNEFSLYDGEYSEITPNEVDIEKGVFSFDAQPVLPVTITTRSYCPYNAASDLMLQSAATEAGELTSYSARNGSMNFSPSSDIRTQAESYRKQGRKAYAV